MSLVYTASSATFCAANSTTEIFTFKFQFSSPEIKIKINNGMTIVFHVSWYMIGQGFVKIVLIGLHGTETADILLKSAKQFFLIFGVVGKNHLITHQFTAPNLLSNLVILPLTPGLYT